MFNILVVEDDKNIQMLTKIKLEDEGYIVNTALDGVECLSIMEEKPVDLIILDIMMPQMDGITVVKTLRSQGKTTPIIIVSAKSDFPDKAEAFTLGVDDYMVKPINFDELSFRIKALLRRAQIVNSRVIELNDCILSYDTMSLMRKSTGEAEFFSKKVFNILFKLVSYPEKVFTKTAIYEELWGTEIDESILKVHINAIRNKLKNFPEIKIETVRGLGYKAIINKSPEKVNNENEKD